VLRPDGSTLYTFRDVVYSLKKCDRADIVWNVICSEQNLAQVLTEPSKGGLTISPWSTLCGCSRCTFPQGHGCVIDFPGKMT